MTTGICTCTEVWKVLCSHVSDVQLVITLHTNGVTSCRACIKKKSEMKNKIFDRPLL